MNSVAQSYNLNNFNSWSNLCSKIDSLKIAKRDVPCALIFVASDVLFTKYEAKCAVCSDVCLLIVLSSLLGRKRNRAEKSSFIRASPRGQLQMTTGHRPSQLSPAAPFIAKAATIARNGSMETSLRVCGQPSGSRNGIDIPVCCSYRMQPDNTEKCQCGADF